MPSAPSAVALGNGWPRKVAKVDDRPEVRGPPKKKDSNADT